MDLALIQTITAASGIISFAFSAAVGVLFFVYSGPPPIKNVLMRDFLNLFASVSFIIFVAGFSHLAFQAHSGYQWMSTLFLVFGMAFIITTLVGQAIESASVLGKTKRLDPTLVGSGAEAAIVIYGPIGRTLTAALLVCAGVLVLGTGVVAAWAGWFALAVAVLHVALIPTLFSGYEPAKFYSINGIGIPIAGGLLMTWVLITCTLLLL